MYPTPPPWPYLNETQQNNGQLTLKHSHVGACLLTAAVKSPLIAESQPRHLNYSVCFCTGETQSASSYTSVPKGIWQTERNTERNLWRRERFVIGKHIDCCLFRKVPPVGFLGPGAANIGGNLCHLRSLPSTRDIVPFLFVSFIIFLIFLSLLPVPQLCTSLHSLTPTYQAPSSPNLPHKCLVAPDFFPPFEGQYEEIIARLSLKIKSIPCAAKATETHGRVSVVPKEHQIVLFTFSLLVSLGPLSHKTQR